MITSDKEEAERRYSKFREANWRALQDAYISGREDERVAKFMTADYYVAADAIADLRRQLDEARVVAKSERERIAALLDEIGATWAAGCVRTMPPPGERVP